MSPAEKEIYDKIQAVHNQLHTLSNLVAEHRDTENINWHYLSGKAREMSNTANHVKDQVQHLKN